MKRLRIYFQVPDTVIEHAHRGCAPIPTSELPISDSLKALLAELSHLHAEAVAKGVAPSVTERSAFRTQYDIVIPMLEVELAGYGHVADEVFPDVFESWYGGELERAQASRMRMPLRGRLARAFTSFWPLCLSGWRAVGRRH